MRHLLSHIAIIALTAFLLVIAFGFACMRASQVALTTEPILRNAQAGVVKGTPGVFEWKKLGAMAYVRNCQNCHGSGGKGWDQYPGLGHSSHLAQASGGRDYLVDVHLYGIVSDRWRAPMPPLGTMPDAELAAVLNYLLTNFGNEEHLDESFELYQPGDIANRRGRNLRPADVEEQRPPLDSETADK